jgi:hypothetical protein
MNAGIVSFANAVSDGNGFLIKLNAVNRGDFGAWLVPILITEQ